MGALPRPLVAFSREKQRERESAGGTAVSGASAAKRSRFFTQFSFGALLSSMLSREKCSSRSLFVSRVSAFTRFFLAAEEKSKENLFHASPAENINKW